MPKLGMEPLRRSALVEATIAEIGAAGSADVTVVQIAKRAGVSSGLAHHYFGGKDDIMLAAMRHILREFGQEALAALRECHDPRARVEAIIRASFSEAFFHPETVVTWMVFYAQATAKPPVRRLLTLYQRRLQSNLTYALRPLSATPEAHAQLLAAVIDGFYLRAAVARGMAVDEALSQSFAALDGMIGPRP